MLDSGSNMETVQLVIGIIVIVATKFIIIKTIYNKIRISNLTEDDLKFDEVRSIYKALKKRKNPKKEKVYRLTQNIEKRVLVYDLLYKFNKIDVYPTELLTIEKLSESYLANWLNMNDDFDSFPNKIEYDHKIELENEKAIIAIEFEVYEPHMYAKRGVMVGYVGYDELKHGSSYIKPDFITSQFNNKALTQEQLSELFTK